MKIQVLSMNFAPEEIGIAVYSAGLSDDLAARGHEVTSISAHPYYPQWRRREGWPKLSYKTGKKPNHTIIHCPHYVPGTPTAKKRMLHYASFAITALPRLLLDGVKSRPDVVFVVAPSLVSAMSGWICAKIFGAKLWLHVQDFEVEAAFATGAINRGSRLAKLALSFETWMLSKFDVVSSISNAMRAKLLDKGVDARAVVELRNWANLAHVTPLDGHSPLREIHGIDTEFVAYYSGNIASKQGLEIIPKAARLLSHRTDLTFVICGDGPFLEQLKAQATGLQNIRFLPLQPFDQLSEALAMADVHLLPQIEGVAELVLPSKLTNMLASGRPVVATAMPGTDLEQEVEGAGRVTPPGDAPAFANAIEQLLDSPEERRALGAAARERALSNWDMSAILGRFENQLRALVRHDRPLGTEHINHTENRLAKKDTS